ncbi:hypothetical protein E2C01_061409 [Portunus trituberculatus]|uniref:Uncharacterized protein n=1 Tax=Portunus trituberculatus TaxID=210409 RepID=A0A5B7HBL1_PORTR|nr:hypothetical protein [Portunus trituberculatus]
MKHCTRLPLQIDFQLTRRWTVIMMNLYFPTNMLLATGYATLFLNVHDQGVSKRPARMATVARGEERWERRRLE